MTTHDQRPPLVRTLPLAGYFELLVRAMYASARAGAASALRWADIRQAMDNFEPSRLASMSTGQMEMLADDPRVGGDDGFIESVVGNAEAMMAIEREGGFEAYLRGHPSVSSLVAALVQDFHGLDTAGGELYVRLLEGGDGSQVDLGLEQSA